MESPEAERARLARRYDYLPNRRPIETPPALETLPDGVRVERFTFRGHNRRVLGAVLARPAKPAEEEKPRPVILYLARSIETPEAAIDVVRALGASSPAVLAIDAGAGAQLATANLKRAELARSRLAALDARFAIDVIAALPALDAERLIAMGASRGAAPACIAGSVDPRVKGVVSIVGGGDPAAVQREKIAAMGDRAAEGAVQLRLVDPRAFLPLLGARPILFIQATRDPTPRAFVDELVGAAPARKRVVWLAEDHQFSFDRAAPAVRDWLTQEMGW